MTLTRRHKGSVLRTLLPLLALVWASLPLHHCNLAFADPAGAASPASAGATADAGGVTQVAAATRTLPCHQLAESAPPAPSSVSCSDLGRAGPDLRPALALDGMLVHVSFDSRWLERGLRPVALPGAQRPLDDGRWRLRPLHLQKSSLLI